MVIEGPDSPEAGLARGLARVGGMRKQSFFFFSLSAKVFFELFSTPPLAPHLLPLSHFEPYSRPLYARDARRSRE
jgi:hypothetical protein